MPNSIVFDGFLLVAGQQKNDKLWNNIIAIIDFSAFVLYPILYLQLYMLLYGSPVQSITYIVVCQTISGKNTQHTLSVLAAYYSYVFELKDNDINRTIHNLADIDKTGR